MDHGQHKLAYNPTLSMLRAMAIGAVIYCHTLQQLSKDQMGREAQRHGEPFVMSILFNISGLLHKFSWRRSKQLLAIFLIGMICDVTAYLAFPTYIRLPSNVDDSHLVWAALVYHMWYVIAIWVCGLLLNYPTLGGVCLPVVYIVQKALFEQKGGIDLFCFPVVSILCSVCVAALGRLQTRKRDIPYLRLPPAAVLPWVAWSFHRLAYVVVDDYGPMQMFWDYVAGSMLQGPHALEGLQKQVSAVWPWCILAYFLSCGTFAASDAPRYPYVDRDFVERVAFVFQSILLVSASLAACNYKGRMLWSRSLDNVFLLAYLTHMFFIVVAKNIVVALEDKKYRLSYLWCVLITAAIVLLCVPLSYALGVLTQRVHACFSKLSVGKAHRTDEAGPLPPPSADEVAQPPVGA